MRSVFDQYSQEENRLTHALLVALAEDRALLARFVAWAAPEISLAGKLSIYEQGLPGERRDWTEKEAEERGLPDGCIAAKGGAALMIESKAAAPLVTTQLQRHLKTARRRGLAPVHLLCITALDQHRRLPNCVSHRSWSDIYNWLIRQRPRSSWAGRCTDYLEVAEAKMADSGYLKEGMVTKFDGIHFGSDAPYTYVAGKRLLGLLRQRICTDRRLDRIGADREAKGRGAITGRDGTGVWDYIPLKLARKGTNFTQYPHLTIGLGERQVEAYVTIPNGVRSRIRSRLLGENQESFRHLLLGVLDRFAPIVRATGGVPTCVLVQRHYMSQRSPAILDSRLQFDLRTALPHGNRSRGKVRSQPEWVETCFSTLKARRSNLQFQVGVFFPYDKCRVVGEARIARVFADVYLACGPILKAALGSES